MTSLTLPTAASPVRRDLDTAGEPSVMDLARKMQDRVAYRRIGCTRTCCCHRTRCRGSGIRDSGYDPPAQDGVDPCKPFC